MGRLLESIASKSTAAEVEETHPLMFVMGMRQIMEEEGNMSCTADMIKMRVLAHNEKHVGAAKIGQKKLAAIMTMLMDMPVVIYLDFVLEYHDRTWDMMSINATTAGADAWKLGHEDKGANGSWKPIYRNTTKSIELTRKVQLTQFQSRLPSVDVNSFDCQRARAKEEELTGWSLRCRLFENWLLPKVAEEFGLAGHALARTMYLAGHIDNELDDIVAVRGKSEIFTNLNIYSVPTLQRRLQGKTAAKTVKEEREEASVHILKEFDDVLKAATKELKELEQKAGEAAAQKGMDVIKQVRAKGQLFEKGCKEIAEEAATHTLTASWPPQCGNALSV